MRTNFFQGQAYGDLLYWHNYSRKKQKEKILHQVDQVGLVGLEVHPILKIFGQN